MHHPEFLAQVAKPQLFVIANKRSAPVAENPDEEKVH
jgi:hypothetical protein